MQNNLAITNIDGQSIESAWFGAISELIWKYDHDMPGVRRYTVETGSDPGQDRIEFDLAVVHIKQPGIRPLIPIIPEHLNIPPIADEAYLNNYMCYLLTDEKGENEGYTYGERLSRQFEFTINYYRKHGTENNRMCMEIGYPNDVFRYADINGSSPCLRLIDTRVKDGRLHWIAYFRSWNLWNGFPVNMAALQMAKELMTSEIGVEDGELIGISKGLNLRGYNEPLARRLVGR